MFVCLRVRVVCMSVSSTDLDALELGDEVLLLLHLLGCPRVDKFVVLLARNVALWSADTS